KSGAKAGKLRATFAWIDASGSPLLEERLTMIFRDAGGLRIVDIDSTLKALAKAEFGDDKDGAFAVRMADSLTERKTGVITSSTGGRTMKEVWGKPANWVDYSGEVEGEKLGVAIFDHPASFRHPARWHSRDYGLLAVNPFGTQAYDRNLPAAAVTLERGKSVRLRYRVVIHPAMEKAAIEALYRAYVAE
ncbi:MAG: PmoA family protein, partial [Bryobacteraceae bacterium]